VLTHRRCVTVAGGRLPAGPETIQQVADCRWGRGSYVPRVQLTTEVSQRPDVLFMPYWSRVIVLVERPEVVVFGVPRGVPVYQKWFLDLRAG
jgi:hypothetical protein